MSAAGGSKAIVAALGANLAIAAAKFAGFFVPGSSSMLAEGVHSVADPGSRGLGLGGGQRAEDLDFLLAQLKKHELPEEAFQWYLDLRRYGTVPHAGFGLGLERTVNWVCGREHVRECAPFPRLLYRIYPYFCATPDRRPRGRTSPGGRRGPLAPPRPAHRGRGRPPCRLPRPRRRAVRAAAGWCSPGWPYPHTTTSHRHSPGRNRASRLGVDKLIKPVLWRTSPG